MKHLDNNKHNHTGWKQTEYLNIFLFELIFFAAHILTVKSTDVINNTKDGSRLLQRPSEPRQRDSEREQDPETDAAKSSHRYSWCFRAGAARHTSGNEYFVCRLMCLPLEITQKKKKKVVYRQF